MRRGAFALPPSVTIATERFKTEADPLRGFIEERIQGHHPNDPVFTPRTELYMAYTTWATVNGFHQMSAQRFYESFNMAATDALQYPVVVTAKKGIRGFRGIGFK